MAPDLRDVHDVKDCRAGDGGSRAQQNSSTWNVLMSKLCHAGTLGRMPPHVKQFHVKAFGIVAV
ncbi:hypothetical protein OG625_00515 [Streptomyces sp. NBC_01351]|uniref:hypothetical protein n=1 Tax=Streptomyces sp. NBC_01351 TaxID=2903833 RepID=UPI002E2FF938|nr:hypothetical protein [Streptomyces sp. NBC_01351]